MTGRIVVPISPELIERALHFPPGFFIENASARVESGNVVLLLEVASPQLPVTAVPLEVTPVIRREPERLTWTIGDQEFAGRSDFSPFEIGR